MAGRLDDRVAVITGGASGIGRECARRFVAEGARVVLGDLNATMLDEAAAELGGACRTAVGDVTVEADVAALVATAVEGFGGLDAAVNAAGLGAFNPVVDLEVEQWDPSTTSA